MSFFRRHWYDVGAVVAVGALIYLAFAWQGMAVPQLLLLLNFVALLIHQFEEYHWPGGAPALMNMIMQPSSTPDRYPLNQNNTMVGNVLAAYLFYLIPVFFPAVIWLGLPPVLFGMGQLLMHGIVGNRKLRTWYNPGLAAVVLLHIPIGVAYIYYVVTNGLASGWDWLLAVVYLAAFAFIFGKMVYTWLADRNSPYAFDEVEMRRFNVPQKAERLNMGKPANSMGR